MAFAFTVDNVDAAGLAYITGTYTNDGGSTGGTIATGRSVLSYANASTATTADAVQTAISGGDVTITTTANETGTWFAVGQ